MKNLIYICLFFNEKYVKLSEILISSLKRFGKIDKDTDLLILTNECFKDKLSKYCENLEISHKVHVLNMASIEESKWSRYEIFRIKNEIDLYSYSKVLYLDIDVIIQKDIKNIFNYELDEKLYARDQGDIGGEYYGKQLFDEWETTKEGRHIHRKTSGFCSGVLLFKPCEIIEDLFEITLRHIIEYKNSGRKFGTCIDQPFLNFNTIIRNLNDIELLKEDITNSPSINTRKETICHFAGDTCNFEVKILKMQEFYDERTKVKQQL